MPSALLPVAELAAILVLVLAVYYPRHRRRDLVTAYLAVNVGVLAVSMALADVAGIGIGLGLFGVLSIIRLRSAELGQHEIAYYFASLALGLLGGLGTPQPMVSAALMGVVVVVLAVGDHPRLLGGYRHQQVVLDRAYPQEAALRSALEELLGARVRSVTVRSLDLVNDSTTVQVVFVLPTTSPPTGAAADEVAAPVDRALVDGSRR